MLWLSRETFGAKMVGSQKVPKRVPCGIRPSYWGGDVHSRCDARRAEHRAHKFQPKERESQRVSQRESEVST